MHVDPDTRYRYYDLGQTRVAGLIHLGRQMGLTVDQLADLIAASEAGDLRSHLERHREAVAASWRSRAACCGCSTASSSAATGCMRTTSRSRTCRRSS